MSKAKPKPPLAALVAPFFEPRARKADPSKMLTGPIQTQGQEAKGWTRQRPEAGQTRPKKAKASQARPIEAKGGPRTPDLASRRPMEALKANAFLVRPLRTLDGRI